MFDIAGLQRSNYLKHPQQGSREGFSIGKANKAQLDILKNYIGKSDLESLFVMEPEKSARSSMFGNTGSSEISSTISNVKPRTYEDIPIETLVSILRSKLEKIETLDIKQLIGGDIMLLGTEEQVNNQKELYTEGSITIEVIANGKCITIIKTTDL